MITYYDLTIPLQSLLILCMFSTVCIGGVVLGTHSQRKNSLLKLTVIFEIIISVCLTIVYTAEARARLRGLVVPKVSEWLCEKPVVFPAFVCLIILISFIYMLAKAIKFRKNTITRASIKEGVDKLSSGLCFYMENGRVVLANKQMNELCFAIVGRDLQNAKLFWDILSGGNDTLPEVQRLSFGNQPSFRFADGTIWSFAHEKLDSINQISAADTTQILNVTDELKKKNIDLAAMNHRLRKHGENVDELTRSKERLETKARIHSELGQALLSTRRYLLESDENDVPPLEVWQRCIAMLRKEAEIKEDEQPLEMLSRISSALGITIEMTGAMPNNKDVQKLFVQAAAEALTNAIHHACAKVLYMELSDDEHDYIAKFKNNGEIPGKEITEGGGLSSLRKKIETEGGTMTVTSEPEFELIITLPKERGDWL